jgi:DNA-binding transcriptional regulator YbjK
MHDRAPNTKARPRRSDARANRERLIEAAMRTIACDGLKAPVAVIAGEAGVGVAIGTVALGDRMIIRQENLSSAAPP